MITIKANPQQELILSKEEGSINLHFNEVKGEHICVNLTDSQVEELMYYYLESKNPYEYFDLDGDLKLNTNNQVIRKKMNLSIDDNQVN